MNFNEKVVLITGAAGGIGSACAEKFAALGAKVAVVDCDKQGAENVAAAIAEKGFAAKAFIACRPAFGRSPRNGAGSIFLSTSRAEARGRIVRCFGSRMYPFSAM